MCVSKLIEFVMQIFFFWDLNCGYIFGNMKRCQLNLNEEYIYRERERERERGTLAIISNSWKNQSSMTLELATLN